MTTPRESFYQQIEDLTQVCRPGSERFFLGEMLDQLLSGADHLYDSLYPIQEINYYGRDDGRTLFRDAVGARNYHIAVCEPRCLSLGTELNTAITNKDLGSVAWKSFSDLLKTLNFVIKMRLSFRNNHKTPVSRQSGNKTFIADRSEHMMRAITFLTETIKSLTENLSDSAKDFIEHHINAKDTVLIELKKVYNQKFPEFPTQFRTMFGFDKNADGSPRIKVAKSQPVKQDSGKGLFTYISPFDKRLELQVVLLLPKKRRKAA